MRPERVKLTEGALAALAVPEAGEAFYWDADIPGFGVRISAKGEADLDRTVALWSQQRRYKVGQWPELRADKARKQARDVLAAARNRQDPQAAKLEVRERIALTLGSVAALYLSRVVEPQQRPKTVAERKRHLERDWKPLHALPLDRLDRASIAAELARIAASHGPIAANRSRGTLHAMFVWAMGEGIAGANPVIGTNKPGQERTRERVLSAEELRLIWQVTGGPGDFNAIIRLLMLTGQRRDEVAGIRWSELDLEKALWSLPGSRTKNRRARDVPLSSAVLGLIASLPRREQRDLAFGKAEGPFSGWPQSKARLGRRISTLRAQAAGRSKANPNDQIEPWVLHDVRRSVVTHMAELGIQPHVIEAVVNHVSGHKAGVAGVYNRATYAKEKREALARWGEWLLEVCEGRKQTVVALTSAARAVVA